ncbi:MAG: Spy/CpxP family protein refolding chaperone [Hyphomicrobiales bacterium]|nr:Spy/CpxP family protein refolding chaperone [Hyphomicrobiales bacterium]
MVRRSIAAAAISLFFAAGGQSLAQTASPAPAPAGAPASSVAARGAKMIERLCGAPVRAASGRYADRLAERLSLNDGQKALLKAWQDARQKAREDARATLCSPKPDLSTFAGRLDWRGKRLATQLASFTAERPKLEAFYASLDEKQKAAWDEARSRREERRSRRR